MGPWKWKVFCRPFEKRLRHHATFKTKRDALIFCIKEEKETKKTVLLHGGREPVCNLCLSRFKKMVV